MFKTGLSCLMSKLSLISRTNLLFPCAKIENSSKEGTLLQIKRWSRIALSFDGFIFFYVKGDIPLCSLHLTFKCLYGYSLFTHCYLDKNKSKHGFCWGVGSRKKVFADLKKHATEIFNCDKREMVILIEEEEKLYQGQKVCYIWSKNLITNIIETKLSQGSGSSSLYGDILRTCL